MQKISPGKIVSLPPLVGLRIKNIAPLNGSCLLTAKEPPEARQEQWKEEGSPLRLVEDRGIEVGRDYIF